MSTFTKLQLLERAREKVKSLEFAVTQTAFADSRAELEEELELARIALASLEAEAVAWTWEIYGGGNMYAKIKPESLDARPLYTAPPSPVSVPDDEQGKPHPVMAVKGELGFLDHFDRIISERDEDIDIGQLGSSNYEALMLAALDAFRDAMLQGAEPVTTDYKLRDAVEIIRNSGIEIDAEKIFAERDALNTPDCWCRTCRPVTVTDMRFVVCPDCGNKRCPHANDHRNACTGSNEPGQEGSAYPAAPQQEVK